MTRMPEQQNLPFHEKHLPTLTRGTKWFGWKLMHLYFPMAIHWMTDKYEGRIHHLVVDVLYAVITFIFLAMNIGIGWWYLNYYTPAEMHMEILGKEKVVSGQDMSFSVMLFNQQRDIEDVTVDVYMPDGFLSNNPNQPVGQPIHNAFGDVSRNDVKRVDITGGIFGSVNDEYTIRVVTSYTWAGRRQQEVAIHHVKIRKTSFRVKVDFPNAVTYGYPLEGTITYKNTGKYRLENIVFTTNFPDNFTVQKIAHNELQLNYNTESKEVTIPFIPPHERGKILVSGTFIRPVDDGVIAGDQQSDFSVGVQMNIAGIPVTESRPAILHATTPAAFQVVNPRLVASLSATPVVNFGDTVIATVVASNVGDVPLENVRLSGQVAGEPVSNASASVSVNDAGTALYSHGDYSGIIFPTIASLPAGESRTFTVRIPTAVLDSQQASSSIQVFGTAYSPDIAVDIPMDSLSASTQYNSRVNLSASVVYYGPGGEEIGYGPYPPQPDQPTAMRVVFQMNNINNPLRNVTILTQLPTQVEWTGLSSVSTGGTITYHPENRTVEWHISALDPQSAVYGGQFEVRFTPNSQQIGLRPYVAQDVHVTAMDNYTNGFIQSSAGSVAIPVSVVEAAE